MSNVGSMDALRLKYSVQMDEQLRRLQLANSAQCVLIAQLTEEIRTLRGHLVDGATRLIAAEKGQVVLQEAAAGRQQAELAGGKSVAEIMWKTLTTDYGPTRDNTKARYAKAFELDPLNWKLLIDLAIHMGEGEEVAINGNTHDKWSCFSLALEMFPMDSHVWNRVGQVIDSRDKVWLSHPWHSKVTVAGTEYDTKSLLMKVCELDPQNHVYITNVGDTMNEGDEVTHTITLIKDFLHLVFLRDFVVRSTLRLN